MTLLKTNKPTATRGRVILLSVIIIILLGVSGYALLRSKINSKASNSGAMASSNASQSQSDQNSYQDPVIQTETDPTLGQYLADANGLPLYINTNDSAGNSSCDSSCLETWPAYVPSGSTSLPANVTITTRSDGTKQYAYKGMPLYYYIYDTEAGQINGNDTDNFQIAAP